MKKRLIIFSLSLALGAFFSSSLLAYASNCPQCTRKYKPILNPDGTVKIWDCTKKGDDCEIPPAGISTPPSGPIKVNPIDIPIKGF